MTAEKMKALLRKDVSAIPSAEFVPAGAYAAHSSDAIEEQDIEEENLVPSPLRAESA